MKRILAISSILLAAGCGNANWGSVYRDYETVEIGEGSRRPEATSVLIDAKQRAILSVPSDERSGFYGGDPRYAFICAEPSPDAVSAVSTAIATSLSAKVADKGEGSAALGVALKEAVEQLSKRNATIQLLRDGLYRQCEAYMNGLISPIDYLNISHRYVDAMVTLLAIEQLTAGGAEETPVSVKTISADGSETVVTAETSINIGTQPKEPQDGKKAEGDETSKKTDGKTADPQKPIGESSEAKGEDKKTVEKNTDSQSAAEEKAGQEESQEPGQGSTRGAAKANAGSPTITIPPSEKNARTIPAEVASTVEAIAKEYLNKNTRDQCLRQLSRIVQESFIPPTYLPPPPPPAAAEAPAGTGAPEVAFPEPVKLGFDPMKTVERGSVMDVWLNVCSFAFSSHVEATDTLRGTDGMKDDPKPSSQPATTAPTELRPQVQSFSSIRGASEAEEMRSIEKKLEELKKTVDQLQKDLKEQ